MHKDHKVSRRARRKDTLSAEDLGILLQWHWKYGTSIFANERQRVQMSLLMLFSAFTGTFLLNSKIQFGLILTRCTPYQFFVTEFATRLASATLVFLVCTFHVTPLWIATLYA